MRIAVIDVETTGVEPWRHSLWELGAVVIDTDDLAKVPEVHSFRVQADIEYASPDALRVNRYFERTKRCESADPRSAARELAARLSGVTFAACNVSFDVQFVTRFLRDHGAVPTWGYSPIDIKSLCYGRRRSLLGASTNKLLQAYGVEVDQCLAWFDVRSGGRHSALADAYLGAALLYEAMGWGTLYGSRCNAHWGGYRCARPFGHEKLSDRGDLPPQAHSDRGAAWETGQDGRPVSPRLNEEG